MPGRKTLTDPEQRQANDSVEAELIEKAKLGDAQAFQSPSREAQAACVLPADDFEYAEAEDSTQEAFLRALPQDRDVSRESAFSTWVASALVNVVLMHLRKRVSTWFPWKKHARGGGGRYSEEDRGRRYRVSRIH